MVECLALDVRRPEADHLIGPLSRTIRPEDDQRALLLVLRGKADVVVRGVVDHLLPLHEARPRGGVDHVADDDVGVVPVPLPGHLDDLVEVGDRDRFVRRTRRGEAQDGQLDDLLARDAEELKLEVVLPLRFVSAALRGQMSRSHSRHDRFSFVR